MSKLKRLEALEKEIQDLKEECGSYTQYHLYYKHNLKDMIVKFTGESVGTVIFDAANMGDVGTEYDDLITHKDTNTWTEIAYDKERGLYDKQVIWCWDEGTFGRTIRFYDAINKCTFYSILNERGGCAWKNYEAVEPSQIPQFMLDAYDKLED